MDSESPAEIVAISSHVVRGAVGNPDRGNTAASQLKPGDIALGPRMGNQGVRCFRAGGVFAEQVIRPTGLIDPQGEIRPVERQVDDLLDSLGF